MKRAAAALLLALLGACDDGPSGPEPVREVDIQFNSVPVDADTIQTGETLQLAATLRDGGGRALSDRRATWRSTDATVARVDSTGLITGVGAGTARVIATAEMAADTAIITVLAPTVLPDNVACAAGTVGIQLQLGQVLTVSAQQQPLLCLEGGAGSEYTLIPFHAAASTARVAVEVAAGGVVPAVGPPNPALLPVAGGALLSRAATDATPLDRTLDLRLREWENRQFASARSSLLRSSEGPSFNQSALTRAVPVVGDTIHLNVNAVQGCTSPSFRVGRVEAVTQHAIVVADTANPAGGFNRDEYRKFGITFDTLVWKVDVANFGVPGDLDKNEKILIFFTKAVNDLTEAGSGSMVGGFFYGRDLLGRTGTDGCAGSNQGELFYMVVPDPARAEKEPGFAKNNIAGSTVAVIAHEFQHLINFSRRLYVNNATENEETWLNEGLSHIAEELVFYEAAGLQPELNLNRQQALGDPVFDKFVEYQLSNFGRYLEYLKNPADASPFANDDELSTRGATWAFLRYAADRKSGPGVERQIWFDLVNSRVAGVRNLQAVFGVDPLEWLRDWTVSVYTDDLGLLVDAQYQQPSWNFRSIYPAFRSTGGQYPLATVQLQNGVSAQRTFSLQGGGAAFVRFGVASGTRAAIRTSSGGRVAPTRLRVMIVRTK